MNRFTPLFSQVVDSSIWEEPYFVRVLWMTMLAKKDSDHVVRGNAYNISRWARMTEKEVIEGLKILASPDTKRLEPQTFDGRRIEKVEDGWFVLNGDKYEKMMRKVSDQVRKARWAREQRARMRVHGAPKRDEESEEAIDEGLKWVEENGGLNGEIK